MTVAVFVLSACGARLVAAIRAALVKGRSSGDVVYAAADETAKELRERICQLHQIQKQTANGGGTGISPARVMYNLHSLSQRAIVLAIQSHKKPTPSSRCSSTAKGARNQSRHGVRRSGHREGADGSAGRRSVDASVSQQGGAAV